MPYLRGHVRDGRWVRSRHRRWRGLTRPALVALVAVVLVLAAGYALRHVGPRASTGSATDTHGPAGASQLVVTGRGWTAAGVQGPVPKPGSCHYRQVGADVLPDPRRTPGAVDRAVTGTNLRSTVCRPGGYTTSVRPPESLTEPVKRELMAAYGIPWSQAHNYELDHLEELAAGGSSDVRNLWPEPNTDAHRYPRSAFTRNEKDAVVPPRRWRHVQAVASTAAQLAAAVSCSSRLLVSAAWLHDIGHAPTIAATGFHPLDGARFLRSAGWPADICALVVHHACARIEAGHCGHGAELAEEFADVAGAERDALWTADATTGPDGQRLTLAQRVDEVLQRYGQAHLVSRCMLSVLATRRGAPVHPEQLRGVRRHRGDGVTDARKQVVSRR